MCSFLLVLQMNANFIMVWGEGITAALSSLYKLEGI